MFGLEQIILNPAMLAAAAALAVGFAVLWANPKRGINRVFFSASIHVALWLLCLELSIFHEEGLFWLRMATMVGAFIPFHLWVTKEVVRDTYSFRNWQGWGMAAMGVFLGWICFTEWFIPFHSTPELRIRGWAYYTYIAGVITLYVILCVQTVIQTRSTSGVKKLELQVLLLGGCAACFAAIGLMVMNAITHQSVYIHLQPIVVLGFYSGTAWAMITSRVFDARHFLYVGLQNVFLVSAVAVFVWSADELLVHLIPGPLAFIIAIGLGLWFATAAGPWFEMVFDLNLRAEDARRIAFETSRRESRPEKLESAYVQLLKGWSKSETAHVLSPHNGQLRSKKITLPADSSLLVTLGELRWATPERLMRERSGRAEQELQKFMTEHKLGVLVATGGRTLNLVLAVGVPVSRRPFTYPQVAQLFELASIIESAMERAHFSVKAQHAEQLATVGLLGASLAHEIRNPLVTIKTFVQLLPEHYGDPVFRDKFFRLIGEEVSRIDGLAEQLLDLATPRSYDAKPMSLHELMQTSLELVAAKAKDREVKIVKDFQARPDIVSTDATAVKQVLLNLSFNAIQAIDSHGGERWIKVATHNQGSEFIELTLEDSGPGIEAEMLPRLFKPFQSTKSSGFGLGLAICSDILTGLNASIAVDPPIPGRGATFRIKFPCQAS